MRRFLWSGKSSASPSCRRDIHRIVPVGPGLSVSGPEAFPGGADRLNERTGSLNKPTRSGAGKGPEAIRAAESMLAINREVLGRTSVPTINAIRLLAQWNRDRQDWTAATRYQSEALDLLTQKYGRDDEDVTVARWMLQRFKAESRISAPSDAGSRKLRGLNSRATTCCFEAGWTRPCPCFAGLCQSSMICTRSARTPTPRIC